MCPEVPRGTATGSGSYFYFSLKLSHQPLSRMLTPILPHSSSSSSSAVCVIIGVAYKEYMSRRHNERQRTLAYLAPYLPRDGEGGLVIYDDEEVGGGKLQKVREEEEGVTIVNEEAEEEEFQSVVPGDQEDDGEKLVPKSSSKRKPFKDRSDRL